MQEANQVWGNTLWTKLEGFAISCIKCFFGFGSNRGEIGKEAEETEAGS